MAFHDYSPDAINTGNDKDLSGKDKGNGVYWAAQDILIQSGWGRFEHEGFMCIVRKVSRCNARDNTAREKKHEHEMEKRQTI